MANELASVTNAFAWVHAYFKDVSRLCGRIRQEFEEHPDGYISLSSSNIDWASSKLIEKHSQWMPFYHYQFFHRGPEETDAGCATRSLLVVGFDHYNSDEPSEPALCLARFDASKSERRLADIRGSIIYFWELDGSETKDDHGWLHGSFQELPFVYRTLPVSAIESIEGTRAQIVDPLIAYDRGAQAG